MDSGLLRSLTSLGDLARLRLLRLIGREELSVGELSRVLQLPQSTVSRHLKLLHDNGWIVRRSAGTASLYRMDPAALPEGSRQLWGVVAAHLEPGPALQQDDHRLAEVLAERRTDSATFFGRLGGEWNRLRSELFGESFTPEALLGFLDGSWVVADLGCGTGSTAWHLAPVVRQVIAVDREPTMLAAARQRLSGFDNVRYVQDDLAQLSLGDGSVDAAVVSLVMVYVEQPVVVVKQAARILRPGGTAMIIDMAAHDRESYRHTMGHRHLGFDERAVHEWAAAAGLRCVRYRRLRPDTSARGPGLFAATLRR